MDDFYEKLGRILGSYLDDEEYFNENYKVNNFSDKKTESRIPDPLNEEPKPVKLRRAGNTVQRERPKIKVKKLNPVPSELFNDFYVLELPPGSELEDCKTAYRNLMKKYHPDNFSGSKGIEEAATEKTSRINNSFRRIKLWYTEKKLEE